MRALTREECGYGGRKRARHGTTTGRGRIGGRLIALVAIAVGILVLLGAPRPAAAQDSGNWSPPRTVYIPETGQTIDGYFLDVWRAGDGADSYGYPITPEFKLNGHIVQYYGYARFEYWPDDPNGNFVHLGKIGEELRPSIVRLSLPGFGGFGQAGIQPVRGVASAIKAWQPILAPANADPDTVTYVAKTGHSVADAFKDFWDRTGGADFLGNPLTQEYVLNAVTYQVFEHGQLALKPGDIVRMVPVGLELAQRYHLDMAPRDQGDVPTYSEDLFVPPPAPAAADTGGSEGYGPGPQRGAYKEIVVSLSAQELWAYEGGQLVMDTLVSTGRPGFDTPTGDFEILDKIPVQTMEGVIGGEYYNVPDVPDVMYFTDRGHALHGTYWHSNFGEVMSHGCVNLPMDVAAWMYDWAPIGTPVTIID